MARGKKVRIYATLEHVDPARLTPSHTLTRPPEAFKLAVGLRRRKKWPYPPALACREYNGEPYKLFDSHHRTHAAILRAWPEIPVYVFGYEEYMAVISRYFKGIEPSDMYRLDRFIVLPDGTLYKDANIR